MTVNFSKTAVPMADILPISSLLCESNRKKTLVTPE